MAVKEWTSATGKDIGNGIYFRLRKEHVVFKNNSDQLSKMRPLPCNRRNYFMLKCIL